MFSTASFFTPALDLEYLENEGLRHGPVQRQEPRPRSVCLFFAAKHHEEILGPSELGFSALQEGFRVKLLQLTPKNHHNAQIKCKTRLRGVNGWVFHLRKKDPSNLGIWASTSSAFGKHRGWMLTSKLFKHRRAFSEINSNLAHSQSDWAEIPQILILYLNQ